MKSFKAYYTTLVQDIGSKEGAVSPTITPSASYGYGSAKMAEAIFSGEAKKPLYARVGNPTTAKLEGVLADLDGGIGAIATSSGMGAISLVCMSLLEAGDEIISIGGLFGGTYSLFSETLARFGIKTHFFDVDELEAIKQCVSKKTKLIFLESVGNPNMRLPDLKAIAKIAKEHYIFLAVDNTITPLSLQPLQFGADIVLYSTTKIITGNASSLGGAAIFRSIQAEDRGYFQRYPFLEKFYNNVGKVALVANAKKRALRDFGMSASAYNSHLTLLGLETLPLRLERIAKSVEQIVLELYNRGLKVNHPVLPKHPHHGRYKEYFEIGCGTLFTIDFGSKEEAFNFCDNSKLATITANIGDSRTLVLHMDSTIYRDFSKDQKQFLGITPGLVRVSVGLENPEDIIEDFWEASRGNAE